MASLIKFNVPPSWNSMGFVEKAGYLCSTHQAKDYSAACAMLARRRKIPKPAPGPTKPARMPYRDD